jgi:hypothetical protein
MPASREEVAYVVSSYIQANIAESTGGNLRPCFDR